MGQSQAPEWKGYDHQLLSDTTKQTFEVEDPNRVKKDGFYTSSNLYRSLLLKDQGDGFGGFLDDPNYKPDKESENKSDDENNSLDIVGGKYPLPIKGKQYSGWAVWKAACEAAPDKPCFGARGYVREEKKEFDPDSRGDFTYDSYSDCYTQTVNIGLSLRFGLKSKFEYDLPDYSNIGIFSRNRAEWMLTHLGNWSQSYRSTALYDTLGFESVKYIVGHGELPVIFTEKDKLETLFKAVEANNQEKEFDLKLKFVVQFNHQKKYENGHETIDESDVEKAKSLGLTLIPFTDLLERKYIANDVVLTDENTPKPKDLAYLMYTSGTTGLPKGVKLSHRAFACVVASTNRSLSQYPVMLEIEWVHVSYLPLAHSFETAVITGIMSNNGKIAFYNGNIKKISEDWKLVKPTVMFGVPRIYNKTHDRVMGRVEAATGIKGVLAHKAKEKSFKEIRSGRRSAIYDKLVWSKVSPQIGYENVKMLASGAAPLAPNVAEFLRVVCMNAKVVQGYGLTETTAVSFFTAMDDLALGHVGIPVDNVEFRLIDVPDKEYFVEPRTEEEKEGLKNGTWFKRGEIQMRGPTMMDGYFKNDEATNKTIDAEHGWLSTGDIGRINPNGTLSIIDRAKALFKLERGEYISPEKVEIAYSQCPAIAQIFVTGNSNLESPVALVVPDGGWLQSVFFNKKGTSITGCNDKLDSDWNEDDEKLDLASDEWVNRINSISSKGNNELWIKCAIWEAIQNMNDFWKKELRFEERIVDIDVECQLDGLLQGFTVKNNTLTPSFKLKRRILEKNYENKLNVMYDKMIEKKKQKASTQKKTEKQQPKPAEEDKKVDDAITTVNAGPEASQAQEEDPLNSEDVKQEVQPGSISASEEPGQ